MTILWSPSGLALSAEERERLQHPQSSGLILFAYNYESPRQLRKMTQEARSICPDLIISVDQEGGEVQRFGKGFTSLPAAAAFGHLYRQDEEHAKRLARICGSVAALELSEVGVNVNYAPVLDLTAEPNGLLAGKRGRSFGQDAASVCALASSYVQGLTWGGVAAAGKHFPGHGAVRADSHKTLPRDTRPAVQIKADMQTFRHCAAALPALLSAHVVYPQIDDRPATFSTVWLKNILRDEIGFAGLLISDDLTMGAVKQAYGRIEEAAANALLAGNDLLLICNDQDAIRAALNYLDQQNAPVSSARMPARDPAPAVKKEQLAQWRRELAELIL